MDLKLSQTPDRGRNPALPPGSNGKSNDGKSLKGVCPVERDLRKMPDRTPGFGSVSLVICRQALCTVPARISSETVMVGRAILIRRDITRVTRPSFVKLATVTRQSWRNLDRARNALDRVLSSIAFRPLQSPQVGYKTVTKPLQEIDIPTAKNDSGWTQT